MYKDKISALKRDVLHHIGNGDRLAARLTFVQLRHWLIMQAMYKAEAKAEEYWARVSDSH